MEIIKKLNEFNNFHLSLKVIQATDVDLLHMLKKMIESKNKTAIIIDENNIFNLLKKAYDDKINFVLIDNKINYLLPLITIITNDDISIIKPMIPVFYCLKNNKIIQKVKTTCNKKYTTYKSFKNNEELLIATKEVMI